MIEIFDANGVKTFDGNTRLVKFLGTLSFGSSFTGTQKTGTLTVPLWGEFPQNTPFFSRVGGIWVADENNPLITISGSTLTWDFPSTDLKTLNGYHYGRPDTTIIYGLW